MDHRVIQTNSGAEAMFRTMRLSMYVTFKTLVQNQWEIEKSPYEMEFYTEPQSHCWTNISVTKTEKLEAAS